jgi:hypothetical protein
VVRYTFLCKTLSFSIPCRFIPALSAFIGGSYGSLIWPPMNADKRQ